MPTRNPMLTAAHATAQITVKTKADARAIAMVGNAVRVVGVTAPRTNKKSKAKATSKCANPSVLVKMVKRQCAPISRKPLPRRQVLPHLLQRAKTPRLQRRVKLRRMDRPLLQWPAKT